MSELSLKDREEYRSQYDKLYKFSTQLQAEKHELIEKCSRIDNVSNDNNL